MNLFRNYIKVGEASLSNIIWETLKKTTFRLLKKSTKIKILNFSMENKERSFLRDLIDLMNRQTSMQLYFLKTIRLQ